MSGISSGSVSELFLDDSGSWSLSVMMDDDDESNLNVFLSGLERAWGNGGLSFRDTFSNINYNNFSVSDIKNV